MQLQTRVDPTVGPVGDGPQQTIDRGDRPQCFRWRPVPLTIAELPNERTRFAICHRMTVSSQERTSNSDPKPAAGRSAMGGQSSATLGNRDVAGSAILRDFVGIAAAGLPPLGTVMKRHRHAWIRSGDDGLGLNPIGNQAVVLAIGRDRAVERLGHQRGQTIGVERQRARGTIRSRAVDRLWI